MMRFSFSLPVALAALALSGEAAAQILVTQNTTLQSLVAFSPVDGSLLSASLFPIPNTAQVSAIDVNGQIWISEQTGDRIVRYDTAGTVLGTIGPTFPGGGFDNIRGMAFVNNVLYVTNDGAGNGATANSLVALDAAGNHLATYPLPSTGSPFGVVPFQGDLLVCSFDPLDDVHRYTLAGTSVGTFHDSTSLAAAHQINLASDGNVWVAGFTTGGLLKLDATTGAVISSFPASGARGIHELQNGNILWTNGSGTWVYDIGTATSTLVLAGSSYHINPVLGNNAYHLPYGTGCHDVTDDRSNLVQFFANVQDAKPVLDGNALRFTLTANGYTASWLPGAAASLYVPPSGTATVIGNVTTGVETFVPSAPIPIPGGTTPSWTLSTEGILTAGGASNNPNDTAPSLADLDTPTGLAFYTWFTQNPTETGSGKFKWEEVAGVVCVTSDGVEFSGGTPTLAPSTYQWQINMTTGDVTMLWTSFSPATSTSDVLVGCTLAGTSLEPVSETLSTMSGHVLEPLVVTLTPVTLSASPAPVINPSTNVTYTIGNIPEVVPGSGVYVALLFLSLNPLPGGFDVTNILTTVPGCNLWVSTLDLSLGGITASPTAAIPFTFSAPIFAPGNTIAAQAIALFDAAFPLANGESGGFLLSNGVMSITRTQ